MNNYLLGETSISKRIQIDEGISQDCFALIYEGQSMHPILIDNMILIIEPNKDNIQSKDLVVVHKIGSSEFIIRKFFKEGSVQILIAENHNFTQLSVDRGDKIIGKIIQARTFY